MKPQMLAGAVVTAIGIIALLFRSGIHYTGEERVPHSGSTQVISKQEKIVTVPLALSGLIILGGVALMIFAARR